MQSLNGMTAVVTGASAGIGRSVAMALAREGMNVVLAARSRDKLADVAAEIARAGGQALAVPTDVSDSHARDHLVERSISTFGTIDVLVNNAGVEAFCDFHRLDADSIANTINTNLTSALLLTNLVLPYMLSKRRGHVINMASTAGKHGPAFGAAYGASKAGLIAFTQSLRGEYHGTGVSASAICPGFTDDGGIYEEMKQRTGRGTPPQMGSTSAKAVSRAVIRAIRKDVAEIIVNNPPMRPVMVLTEAFPALGEWIVRKSTHSFLRRVSRGDVVSRRDAKERAA